MAETGSPATLERQRRPFAAVAVVLAAGLGGCGQDRAVVAPPVPSPSATPDTTSMVIPTQASGVTHFTFVSANVAPGSTVPGCGPLIGGCAGRLRMVFRVRADVEGRILKMVAYLHSTQQIACLSSAQVGPFDVRAGEELPVEVSFDTADACPTPTTIATMAVRAEGPTGPTSVQDFALRYSFTP